jgi:hypothetical protein
MEQIDNATLIKYIEQLKESIKILYIDSEVYIKILEKHNIDYEDDYEEILEEEKDKFNIDKIEDYFEYCEDEYYNDSYIGDGVYAVFGKDDRMNLYIDTEKGPPYYMSLDFYDESQEDFHVKFSKYVDTESEAWQIYNQILEDTDGLTMQQIKEKIESYEISS